jgi:mannitol/fructose-specific phosphotransferase system IIA component (Ntr-type)
MGLKLQGLLSEELIVPALRARERESILIEMASILKARGRIAKDKELAERLAQRERLGSTAIGRGIAIPHCKGSWVKDPLVLLAVSRAGAPFDAADGKPAHLFFLVVTPAENPAHNLEILAAVARLARRARNLLKRILTAETAAEILEIVRDEEDKAAA